MKALAVAVTVLSAAFAGEAAAQDPAGAPSDSMSVSAPAASAPRRPAVYEPASGNGTSLIKGIGVGVPYGVMGIRLGLGTDLVDVDGGLGLVPFAWELGYSVNLSVHGTSRTAAIRPRACASFSNAVAMVLITDADGLDALYSKTYEGFAVYGGIEWRIGKTSGLCLDLNLGAVFPTVGIDQVKQDFEAVKNEYLNRGYRLEDQSEPRNFPVFSLGFTYTPSRKMRRVLEPSPGSGNAP